MAGLPLESPHRPTRVVVSFRFFLVVGCMLAVSLVFKFKLFVSHIHIFFVHSYFFGHTFIRFVYFFCGLVWLLERSSGADGALARLLQPNSCFLILV